MSHSSLDGPRLAPASGGAAKQLVVLLHGYGADGNDLIGLARQWQSLLPDAAFVLPNGPEPCVMNPFGGRQWFELTFRESCDWAALTTVAPDVDRFLDDELRAHRLPGDRLALVGFSQGTMLTLHLGLRRERSPAAIIGYSGMLAGAEHLSAQLKCRPSVLLIHGDQDEVIPVEALTFACDALGEAGLGVQSHISRGLGHGIDVQGIGIGGAFLRKIFK